MSAIRGYIADLHRFKMEKCIALQSVLVLTSEKRTSVLFVRNDMLVESKHVRDPAQTKVEQVLPILVKANSIKHTRAHF